MFFVPTAADYAGHDFGGQCLNACLADAIRNNLRNVIGLGQQYIPHAVNAALAFQQRCTRPGRLSNTRLPNRRAHRIRRLFRVLADDLAAGGITHRD